MRKKKQYKKELLEYKVNWINIFKNKKKNKVLSLLLKLMMTKIIQQDNQSKTEIDCLL